ncbi:MAG: hypothetical protein IJD22_06200 [Clostridia bacterium]|nr:hypothetical protein [Clostridia bacterium]
MSKRILALLIAAMAALCLMSCNSGNSDDAETDDAPETEEATETVSDSEEEVTEGIPPVNTENLDPYFIPASEDVEYEGDKEGRPVKAKECREDGSYVEYKYVYGENGKVEKMSVFEHKANGDEITSYFTYEYDENGVLSGRIDDNEERIEFSYDENGDFLSYNAYDISGFYTAHGDLYPGGAFKSRISCGINGEDDSVILFREDGSWMSRKYQPYTDGTWVLDEYDEIGNIIRITSYGQDGSVDHINEFEYDAKRQMTYQRIYRDGGILRTEYQYENGAEIFHIEYDESGAMSHMNKYEYNGDGDLVKELFYGSDGEVETWYRYEYNEEGKLHMGYAYNMPGDIHCMTIYYNENEQNYRYENYDDNGNMTAYSLRYYDENGSLYKEEIYSAEGLLMGVIDY